MAWYIKSTNELWTGETHEFAGWTWSGATKTSESVKLIEGDEPVKARTKKGKFKSDDPSTPNVDESKAKPKRKTKSNKPSSSK